MIPPTVWPWALYRCAFTPPLNHTSTELPWPSSAICGFAEAPAGREETTCGASAVIDSIWRSSRRSKDKCARADLRGREPPFAKRLVSRERCKRGVPAQGGRDDPKLGLSSLDGRRT